MATLDKARDLIEKLHNASWCPAIKELRDYAREQGANEANNLNQWDINFWSERLRESKYDLNEGPYELIVVATQKGISI
ncbi:hypothetical protein CASFOL_019007 [Castilleja foliolosa]|uniref:Uncharacterized protein n=1 Tax=Castilleja foliolosa TaxID=1961234 RepID=A0ABD3D3W3_9LAMI